MSMIKPDFKEFSRLAREATLVPVVKSVTADLLTPVSAFLAIAEKEPHAFLLESNERGEQIGRYTFLGAHPYMRVKARSGTVEIERGRRREKRQGNVFQMVKELLRQHRPRWRGARSGRGRFGACLMHAAAASRQRRAACGAPRDGSDIAPRKPGEGGEDVTIIPSKPFVGALWVPNPTR